MIAALIAAGSGSAQTAFIRPVEGQAVKESLQARSVYTLRARKTQLRAELNKILPTRETTQGLVVTVPAALLGNSGDVPDSTSKRLAKIASMMPPDVTVRVTAYSDGERGVARADAVREVLVQNDDSPREIETAGFVSSSRLTHGVEIVITGPGLGLSGLTARDAGETKTRTGD